MIRIANNSDSKAVIQLIGEVYAEYGDLVCLDEGGAEAELLDLEAAYAGKGGQFWVLELDGEVKGTHAVVPSGDENETGICGFRRLYMARELRGATDWGHQLMQVTIDWAVEAGFKEVRFWSDTRFKRAHQFFAKFGFEHDGRVREMNDSFETYSEYFYSLQLQSTPS